MLLKTFCALSLAAGLVTSHATALAAESAGGSDELIPHCLLGLIHAPQVQQELNLTPEQREELESLLRTIDRQWLPARNLPVSERNAVFNELELRVWEWFARGGNVTQAERLKQLELQAQSSRLLLRRDMADRIGLRSSQSKKLVELAKATDEARRAAGSISYGDPQTEKLQSRLQAAIHAEKAGFQKSLQADQQERIKSILGRPFDVASLTRVYPMAPEFGSEGTWINSPPLRMSELRGKVVVIHFYAFQCHNCHANFPVYRRWHQEWADKGVVLVGIQTPETRTERDVGAITAAAKSKDLTFPILADLKSESWNAWGNTMWPTVYVVDKQGYIRAWWEGELNWKGATGDKTVENAVEKLLAEQ